MLLMTMIARIADGLPLAASMQEDEQVQCTVVKLSVSVSVSSTGDAVNSFHRRRDTFSTCRYCACAKPYFTVCIVRCVYRAELILGR